MSVSSHWIWNDKPQKSLAKLASGEADLSEGSNRTVTGKAAFCVCYLALLIGKRGCFLCSFFLLVCALLPQLVVHSCFARSFSKQWTNRLIESFLSKINPGSTVAWVLVGKGILMYVLVFISISKLWHQNTVLGKGTLLGFCFSQKLAPRPNIYYCSAERK